MYMSTAGRSTGNIRLPVHSALKFRTRCENRKIPARSRHSGNPGKFQLLPGLVWIRGSSGFTKPQAYPGNTGFPRSRGNDGKFHLPMPRGNPGNSRFPRSQGNPGNSDFAGLERILEDSGFYRSRGFSKVPAYPYKYPEISGSSSDSSTHVILAL